MTFQQLTRLHLNSICIERTSFLLQLCSSSEKVLEGVIVLNAFIMCSHVKPKQASTL